MPSVLGSIDILMQLNELLEFPHDDMEEEEVRDVYTAVRNLIAEWLEAE